MEQDAMLLDCVASPLCSVVVNTIALKVHEALYV